MIFRKISFAVVLISAVLCLIAGYAIVGQWIGMASAVIAGLAWLLARKYPIFGFPHICLVVSVGAAVVGTLTGAPAILMICGSGFALAAWDLLFLDAALGSSSPVRQTRTYESKHLQSLALALGSGLSAALLGRLFNLQIPFFGLLLLVSLAVFGLDRAWGYIKKVAYGR